MPFQFLTGKNDDISRLLGVQDSSKITPLTGGRNSFAFRVGNFVVRFPKNADVWSHQKQEAELLTFIRQRISPKEQNKIPNITCKVQEKYPFTIHPFIAGKTCNQGTNESIFYAALSPTNQTRLARELATFLSELHQIQCEGKLPKASDEWLIPFKTEFDFNLVRDYLLKTKAIDLLNFQTDISVNEKGLIHNDLSGSNILLSPDSRSVLNGIIDFGAAGIGPKICDFIPLYKISRKLARETIEIYNTLSPTSVSLKEADYLALCYVGYYLQKSKSPSKYLTGILDCLITDLLQ